MAATEFNDASHWGFFMTGTTLTSGTGKYTRVSELTLAALRAQGVFDNMVDGTAPPAVTSLWLDKNSDPAVLKEWDATGAAWVPMTFDRLFGRAIVTPLATPTGTADALIVAEPEPFIPRRVYSLTPVADNTGATTIQVTGVGTYAVKYTDGTDIEAQEFKTGRPTILLFTGSRFEVLFSLADIYAIRDQVVAIAAQFPALEANTMLVDNAAGTARETKTFAEVRSLLGLVKSIMDYPGAYGNDVDYDDAAFTAAAADPGKTYLPPRPYKFSPGFKCSVPISNYGKTFFSDPGDGTAYDGNSAVIKTNTSGADVSGGAGAAAFEFLCSQGKLQNVQFLNLGTVKDAAFRAVRFDHEATGINSDDIDSSIEGCQFNDYGVAVRQNGRGIKMKDCKGGNVGDLLVWSFPATGTAGDPIQSNPVFGSRGTEILGNRLHNSDTLVRTTGDYAMRGFIIADNDCDLGDTVAHGSFEDGEFASNLCRFSSGADAVYQITGFGSYLTFTGGVYGGGSIEVPTTGNQAGTSAIVFSTGGDVVGTTINGITGRNFLREMINFITSRPVDCSIIGGIGEGLGRDVVNLAVGSVGMTILGLTGRNYGTDGTSRGFLRLAGQHDRLDMSRCNINPVQATARNVVCVGTPTINKSYITYNRSTYATLITNAFTDGGLVQTPNILG